ncbi:hypothetical protein D9M71_295990 [compost metagenome]
MKTMDTELSGRHERSVADLCITWAVVDVLGKRSKYRFTSAAFLRNRLQTFHSYRSEEIYRVPVMTFVGRFAFH